MADDVGYSTLQLAEHPNNIYFPNFLISRCRRIEKSGGFLLFFIPRLRLNGV